MVVNYLDEPGFPLISNDFFTGNIVMVYWTNVGLRSSSRINTETLKVIFQKRNKASQKSNNH
ncbi:hypothetical protein GIX45_09530 [Erwinia sp. CPCC 100877]|nr:hypothetical protein [Erwinia sp. CPCC 100877]